MTCRAHIAQVGRAYAAEIWECGAEALKGSAFYRKIYYANLREIHYNYYEIYMEKPL